MYRSTSVFHYAHIFFIWKLFTLRNGNPTSARRCPKLLAPSPRAVTAPPRWLPTCHLLALHQWCSTLQLVLAPSVARYPLPLVTRAACLAEPSPVKVALVVAVLAHCCSSLALTPTAGFDRSRLSYVAKRMFQVFYRYVASV
jgi:hypothetical protein